MNRGSDVLKPATSGRYRGGRIISIREFISDRVRYVQMIAIVFKRTRVERHAEFLAKILNRSSRHDPGH